MWARALPYFQREIRPLPIASANRDVVEARQTGSGSSHRQIVPVGSCSVRRNRSARRLSYLQRFSSRLILHAESTCTVPITAPFLQRKGPRPIGRGLGEPTKRRAVRPAAACWASLSEGDHRDSTTCKKGHVPHLPRSSRNPECSYVAGRRAMEARRRCHSSAHAPLSASIASLRETPDAWIIPFEMAYWNISASLPRPSFFMAASF